MKMEILTKIEIKKINCHLRQKKLLAKICKVLTLIETKIEYGGIEWGYIDW